ncbi:hypothetical protein A2U01_0111364, partial [Trifolium medium]|nr:hypothetical protein [Trifolium medium]
GWILIVTPIVLVVLAIVRVLWLLVEMMRMERAVAAQHLATVSVPATVEVQVVAAGGAGAGAWKKNKV